ncbi:MAG: prolyl oligopeptidase family serine peptidase, partial [Candidatus Sericytochromatia bacterium]
QTLTSHIPWNVTALDLSPDGERLVLSTNEDGLNRLYLLDTATLALSRLPVPMGILGEPRFSPDGLQIGFTLHKPNHPADVWSLRLDNQELVRWTESEVGGLNTATFPTPELIRYRSFDDMEIPAFYFKPRQNSDRPYPVIIHIHGGPESQYRPTYSALFQYWLNELDIAIVAPNVRGSTGYGKRYITLDNGYLREDSVKDIGALLEWIKDHPELDEKRVCVYGGSYGGYMVLASLCHYGDKLRCGMEMVGISNFVTFLKNTKSYRRDLRRVEYGDERDPQMCAFLDAISPTTNAHRIKRPLLVAQGLNDPRVPASEAEQIVSTVRGNGQEVWYLLAHDEGHGFHKQPNLEYYYSTLSLFLETHLLD